VTEDQKLRLFVAVDLPRPLLEEVEGAARDLRAKWPEARWTPLDNQHITLKFLGWAPAVRLAEVSSAVAEVAARFDSAGMELGALGVFPSPRRARVLWVGVEDRAGLLGSLSAGLDRALEPLGFESEKRSFTPHLTLARFKIPRSVADEAALGRRPVPGGFDVDRMVLYRSHLSPKGPRYEALQALMLGPDREGPDPQAENQ
jgi:2'-5' RNA ligase